MLLALLIFLFLILTTFHGFYRGLAHQGSAVLAMLLGLLGLLLFDGLTYHFMQAHTGDIATIQAMVAMALPFLLFLWLGHLIMQGIGWRRQWSVRAINPMDALLGASCGLIQGGLMMTLVILSLSLTDLPATDWWQHSAAIQFFQPLVQAIEFLLSTPVRQQLQV